MWLVPGYDSISIYPISYIFSYLYVFNFLKHLDQCVIACYPDGSHGSFPRHLHVTTGSPDEVVVHSRVLISQQAPEDPSLPISSFLEMKHETFS